MDPDASRAVAGDLIDSIHLVDNRLDGLTAEFISENIQANFFILGIKRFDRSCDSFHRAAVAK
jgi:hypothetical protein